jgi:AraC-like DNA-binding protein
MPGPLNHRCQPPAAVPSPAAAPRDWSGLPIGLKSKSKHLQHISRARRFLLDMAPKATRLSVVMGGVELCHAGYVNQRDGFPFLCVELVASGAGRLTLEGQSYKLTPGTIFVYGPDIPHEIRHAGTAKMAKFFATFTGSAADTLLRANGMRAGSVHRARNMERVVAAFENLIANGCAEGPHCREICALSLKALLLVLADNVIPYDAATSKALATFQLARDSIDEDFLALHDLQAIAMRCHLDASYLCRLFQRFARTTPYKYLLRVKMHHAAEMLRSERLLVKELAARLGYGDPYQFSRIFKSVHGLSPENYALLASRIF